MRRPALLLAVLGALLSAAARADYPDAWKWTLEVAPSSFAPRMHGMNNALTYEGLNVLDRGWHDAGSTLDAKVPMGFAKIEWGFGGQVSIGYEFNEDMRGGVLIGMSGVWKTDRHAMITNTATYQIAATVMMTSSTSYSMEEKVSLPLLTLGVFLHKVFRYEEEPALRIYLGGWAAYGTLTGATISGSFTRIGSGDPRSFSTDLTGQGWGAGGVVGIEYAVSPVVAIFGESGYGWMYIPKVQYLGNYGGAGPLTTSNNKPINLDYTGVSIRLGVKIALAGVN